MHQRHARRPLIYSQIDYFDQDGAPTDLYRPQDMNGKISFARVGCA